MQMEDHGVRSHGNCHYKYSQFAANDYNSGGYDRLRQKNHMLMSPTKWYPSPTPSLGLIEHPVSRFDTLAGVAIKYGVEVADIKKTNGLVTDLQMFALKSLQIPLPGRHPPSSSLSNGLDTSREQSPTYHRHSDIFDSFQSLKLNSSQRRISPAMSCLQGYYGLKQIRDPKTPQVVEIIDQRKGDSNHQDNIQYLRPSPASNTPLNNHRRSRSLLDEFLEGINGLGDNQLSIEARESDSEKWNEKLIRRRQKSEADFTSTYPESMMREDSCGGVSTAITGKSLALRSKAASRPVLRIDTEVGTSSDSLRTGGFSSVRKSSSTPSLQEQERGGSSMWTAWGLKPDLTGLSAATIPRPIFDGLPKPITSRRNKAALD